MVIKPTWEDEREWNWKLERSEEKIREEPNLTFSREALLSFLETLTPVTKKLFMELADESFRMEKPINYLEMKLTMKGKHLEEVL
jgi:hypothetical protein